MKAIGIFIIIFIFTSLLGLLLQLSFIPFAKVIFILSFILLVGSLVVQSFLSFKNKEDSWTIIIFSYSIFLAVCFIGILCRYEWLVGHGWKLLYYSIYLFCLSVVLTYIKRKKIATWKKENRRIFVRNIVVPLVYALILGGTAIILSYQKFYETFNSHRNIETYEQFLNGGTFFYQREQVIANKFGAKNQISNGQREGRWFDYIDSSFNSSTDTNAPYYGLTNYSDNKPVGIENIYYKSGKIKEIIPMNEGIVNGTLKIFYESGTLLEEDTYIDGKVNGVSKMYYENGAIRTQVPFTDGKKNGIAKIFYESGALLEEGTYTDDKANGIAKGYYENGRIKAEVTFSNGTIVEAKKYDENGNLVGK